MTVVLLDGSLATVRDPRYNAGNLFTCHAWHVTFQSCPMRRFSFWPMLVALLLGILVLREPRFEKLEENFLRWLLRNATPPKVVIPLTVVEIGRNRPSPNQKESPNESTEAFLHGGGAAISPLEHALFLQSVLEFQPAVVAFETILKWRDRDKDQEQVFLDQAMRVPKLLLGAELTNSPDPDQPPPEIPVFTQVTGNRGRLVDFSGVGRQPNEDMRLISTPGFINLPEEIVDDLRIPLLFRYRGDVIPSFALETVLLWLRITPAEVKIELPSRIILPGNRKIPINAEGALVINSLAAKSVSRLALNQLLLAAQQRGKGGVTSTHLENIRDHIVLARTPANPLAPPDVFASTIATIQSNMYIRRVSQIFDFAVLALTILAAGLVAKIPRAYLVLGALVFTASYCLMALQVLSHWLIWLPGYFPLGLIWLLTLYGFVSRSRSRAALG
jgi:CHASE2 domain-containing protein